VRLFANETGLVEVRVAVGNELIDEVFDKALKVLLKHGSFDADKLVCAAELHPDELFIEWFLISKFLNSVTSVKYFPLLASVKVSGPFDLR